MTNPRPKDSPGPANTESLSQHTVTTEFFTDFSNIPQGTHCVPKSWHVPPVIQSLGHQKAILTILTEQKLNTLCRITTPNYSN